LRRRRVIHNAKRRNVLLLTVSDGMKLAGIGTAIGLAVAIVLTKLMTSVLFGVAPTNASADAFTFATFPIGALAVALLACYIPATWKRVNGSRAQWANWR
jgi:predicted lysophospholipase L1 biosynthesis ABC-type transport system permease subunit